MVNTNNEIIPVVDRDDTIIGYKARKDITYDDIYRVAACWIVDEGGNILLAQRSWNKSHHPGKRGPAVAGTVQQGETYLENIIKEMKEEVGVSVTEKDLFVKDKILKTQDRQHFTQWFLYVYSGDKSLLTPEEGAVEQLKWYTPDELEDMLFTRSEMFLSSTKHIFPLMS